MKEILLEKANDNLLNVPYELIKIDSAKELSTLLKKTYNKLIGDFEKFNTLTEKDRYFIKEELEVAKTPSSEIYEYQNFVLLELENKDLVLLDGFRRLLWYNAPSIPIIARKYKKQDLTNKQILQLLVSLNHFKFFGNSIDYQDRGFGLLLKTAFDIDITQIRNSLNGYLLYSAIKNDYYISRENDYKKNENIKNRIINDFFVNDILFLQKMRENGMFTNTLIGSLIFKRRTQMNTKFNFDKFQELCFSDKIFNNLNDKIKPESEDNSAKGQKIINGIIAIYQKYFDIIEGKEVQKTLEEKIEECKNDRGSLNKHKEYVKLTGNKDAYVIERIIVERIEKNEPINFNLIIYPSEEKDGYEKYGLIENVEIKLKFVENRFHGKEIEMEFQDGGILWKIHHNYGGYNYYGKKYTYIESVYNPGTRTKRRKIELFANISKEEFKQNCK